MMNDQKKLSGGILVLIIKDHKRSYYYGDNSFWLLDDWEPEVSTGTYTDELTSLKVNPEEWSSEVLEKYQPELIINLDDKLLLSNYYDQALETRIPSDWEGRWIESQDDFMKQISVEDRFWGEHI